MFNFNKNDQEKFNKKMNNALEDLEKISFTEALARVAAFNKQSKTFQIEISSKKESRLNNFIKNAGTIIDETVDKVKEKVPEIVEDTKNKTTETIKNINDYINEKSKNIVIREKGDPWKIGHIATLLKLYIRSRNENGRYDPEMKERLSKMFSVDKDKLTNQVNLFINRILYENKYSEIFNNSLIKPLAPKREEILLFKFRHVKYCKDLDENKEYDKLSDNDKKLLKEGIKQRNKN